MRLTTLVGHCEDGNCPKLTEGDDGNFYLQVYRVPDADKPAGIPDDEDLVMVPRDAMLAFARALV